MVQVNYSKLSNNGQMICNKITTQIEMYAIVSCNKLQTVSNLDNKYFLGILSWRILFN